jgi:hypothetical protein
MNNIISIKINKIFKTPHEIINGLMFVTHLKKDTGALFCMPENKIHKFWMKNTYVSLDVIFMDENFKVVGFSEKTTPLDLSLVYVMRPSKFIIEINSGFVKKNNLCIGDLIKPIYVANNNKTCKKTHKSNRKRSLKNKTRKQYAY